MKYAIYYIFFCLVLISIIPLNINAEEIDYKSKTNEQLIQMCFEKNDSFACFMIAGKLKDAGQGRERIAVLKHGASVPGKKNARSLTCMYFLAESHIKGDGVPQNYIKGYKWANILASISEKWLFQGVAKSWRDELIVKMTNEQISEAQKESQIWLDQHKDW